MRTMVLGVCLVAGGAAQAVNTPIRDYLSFERTDVAVTGVGGIGAAAVNGGGEGELVLEDVSGDVTLALLYWNGIDIEQPANGYSGGNGDYDEAEVLFDGTPVVGERVAAAANNNNWDGSVDSAGFYRADVTELVTGSGTYALAGFSDGGGHSTNGVSLIVYFDDGVLENDYKVRHLDGQVSNLDTPVAGLGWIEWLDLSYDGGWVELIVHVSDGQTVHSDAPMDFDAWPGFLPGDSSDIRFDSPHNGQPLWGGRSVPRMGFGRPSTGDGLWDIQRFDLTPLFDQPRDYVVRLKDIGGTDALTLHVLQLLQPAGPLPWITPARHDFGDVTVDATGAPEEFAFVNRLQQPVEILDTGSHSNFPILVDGCSGNTLQAGAQCELQVACRPSAVLERFNRVFIDWRLIGGDTQRSQAGLRCAGVEAPAYARIDIEPAELWFGTQASGSSGTARRFTVTSVGQQSLTVDESRVVATGATHGFVVVGETCIGRELQSGQSCHVDVAFRPPAGLEALNVRAELRVGFETEGNAYPPYPVPISGLAIANYSTIFRDGFED